MKNVTIALDDDIYRRARIVAAERTTSLSAMVAEYLRGLAAPGETFRERLAQERELRLQVNRFQAGNRLSRNELHRR